MTALARTFGSKLASTSPMCLCRKAFSERRHRFVNPVRPGHGKKTGSLAPSRALPAVQFVRWIRGRLVGPGEGKIEIRGLTGVHPARVSRIFFSTKSASGSLRQGCSQKDSESVAHGDLHFSRGRSHPHRVCGWVSKFSRQELMFGGVMG
jgi:hypothetical protein